MIAQGWADQQQSQEGTWARGRRGDSSGRTPLIERSKRVLVQAGVGSMVRRESGGGAASGTPHASTPPAQNRTSQQPRRPPGAGSRPRRAGHVEHRRNSQAASG